jgi:hypothetical protein
MKGLCYWKDNRDEARDIINDFLSRVQQKKGAMERFADHVAAQSDADRQQALTHLLGLYLAHCET